ncbi:HNH endonuclease [Shewanella sp.]|uniref:HNH endonuclease n=1 Tax=Shewanella sp. TaxID=50422 RepID=UPI004053D281
MLNKIIFSDDEINLIGKKLNSAGFTSESWSDDDIVRLKKKIKNHYLTEQKNICPYCKQKINSNHGRYWDIEHIIPRSITPEFMFEPLNLCMSCVDCNSGKTNNKVTNSKAKKKYPIKSTDYIIIHPHFDDYEKHIIVIKEGFYYVARQKKGEKTIAICKLNRFYEFSDFGSCVQDDDRIFMLSEQLRREGSEDLKKIIRREIAELAIKGSG